MRFGQPFCAILGWSSAATALFTFWFVWITANTQPSISILPENLYQFAGPAGANATVSPVTVTGQEFTQAYRVTVNGTSANIHDAGLSWLTTQAVNEGDNLQVAFRVRKVAPLDGNNIRGLVGFENEPYTNFDVQGRIDGVNGVRPSDGVLGNLELYARRDDHDLQPTEAHGLSDVGVLGEGALAASGRNVSRGLVIVYHRISQTVAATINTNGELAFTLDTVAPRPPIRR